MKIRKCPSCAHLVHFTLINPIQRYWNCGQVTDFSCLSSPSGRLFSQGMKAIEAVLALPPRSLVVYTSRAAFLLAMPIAVTMLLVGNSFDIRIVHDIASSFSQP